MLMFRRNLGLILFYVKRCIANSSFSESKHYEFFIKHIKADLNNHTHIIKQTTAIPKEIINLSPVSYRDVSSTIGQTSYNLLLPSNKHSKLKITNDTGNNFLEKNVLIQDVVNNLVTHYSTKEHNLDKFHHDRAEEVKNCSTDDISNCHRKTDIRRDDTCSKNHNDKEYINSNNKENHLYSAQVKQIETLFVDDPITDDSKSFSLNKIKELLDKKIKDILITNFNTNIFSDNLVILNQRIPESESLLYFKNKELNVIESSHTNFKTEVKNYIKKLDIIKRNRRAPERLNFIRFSKAHSQENLLDEPLSSYSKDDTILKVKNSLPLTQDANHFWIPFEEDSENVEQVAPQGFFSFSPQSGPPFTEKVPINKDKLIHENVVPNTSILNIINSIDKSAVIIQKDLYITDQIIQKIQKEEEKQKETEKNKLETITKKGHVMYLDAPSVKRGMVAVSLACLTAGLRDDEEEEAECSNNGQYLIKTENNQSLLSKKNLDLNQSSNRVNNGKGIDSPALVTLKTVDDGKISLNMSYEPNKVVPMLSFLPKKGLEEDAKANNEREPLDNSVKNNYQRRQSHISEPRYAISKDKLKNNYETDLNYSANNKSEDNNYQLSTTSMNRLKLIKKEFVKKKKKCEKGNSETFKEEPRYMESGNRAQINSLKDNIPYKNIFVYDSITTSVGEGIPMDVYVNRSNTTNNSQNISYQQSYVNSPVLHMKKKSENEFSELKQLTNVPETKNSLETLSDVENSLGSLVKDYILKNNIAISNVQRSESENKFSETSREAQNITTEIVKSVEALLKKYLSKRGISVSNGLTDETDKSCSQTPNEEPSLIAHHIVGVVMESLETWLKYNIPKKIIPVSNGLKNESEKKKSESLIEESIHLNHYKMPDIVKSLETLFKDYFLKAEVSASNDPKNESIKQNFESLVEESGHLNHNSKPDIVKSLETLLKNYFLKAEISVSNANTPDKETPMDLQEYNEVEVIENGVQKQDKITHEPQKNCSYKNSEEQFDVDELLLKKKISLPDVNHSANNHQLFNPNNTETNTRDENVLQNKNNVLEEINDELLSDDSIQESYSKSQHIVTDQVDYPQFYSLESSNEASNKFITNKGDIMEPIETITKEGIYAEKRKILSDINSLGRKSDVEVAFSGNFGEKKSVNGRQNADKINKFLTPKKKFKSSNTNHSTVDRIKKTTISSTEKNNFTDINVSEVETFIDSRLPIPFSTETFFQIFGSNNSLRDHSSLINVAKFKLTSPNKITELQTNLTVMAKLEDIRKSVQYLNLLAANSKLLKTKDTAFQNEAFVPKISAKNQEFAKDSAKKHVKTEILKENKEEVINIQNVPNFLPKFTLKMFKNNNLPIKAHNLKRIPKYQVPNTKNTTEVTIQNRETSTTKDEKSLLIVEAKNDNIKETKINIKKPSIQKVELTGIRVSRGKYVDLFNFNKNEKNKRHKLHGNKKGVYDHRGLSKRDKKILREITKEIPKQKSKGKSSRKRPIKPITTKKTGNQVKQPTKFVIKKPKEMTSKTTLPTKNRELVDKTVLPKKHLSNKQILLPPGNHDTEKKEVQKTLTEKNDNTSHKVSTRVEKKSIENTKSEKSMILKDMKLNKSEGKKTSEATPTKAEKLNVSNIGNLEKDTKLEKKSIKNNESKNSTNVGSNSHKFYKKPLCQTYVATETYINQPEKNHLIPDKIFMNKKILEKNTTPSKVTIVENVQTNKENNSNTLKIHEDFKEELIKKSQNKIEHRTNIDFRIRAPKLRSLKTKIPKLTGKQKEKVGLAASSNKTPVLKKDKKENDMKTNVLVPKKNLKNKQDRGTFKEIKTSMKVATTKKAPPQQNIKNEEMRKVSQLEPHNKEISSQTKTKSTETINTKPFDRMTKVIEKPQDKEQLKITTADKLKLPREPIIDKKATKISQSENKDKKNFPMFLIDVDKMSKEIKPELDLKNCQECQVAHDKIIDFPLHSQKKKLLFKPPFKILSHGPSNDQTLRDELKFFPSVTKVLNSTIPEKSREILREWRKNMIDELGENGFKSFYKGQLINGNKFNWQLHNFLLSGEKQKDPTNLGLNSIEKVLKRTSDLSAINSHVIHRKLAYRGVIDCVAKYQNRPVIIEWKRLDSPQVKISNSSIDIAATQMSAYVGALNHDDTYKFQISGGLIVLAYNDGSEAEVIEINNEQCYDHWKKWLRRLQTYHESSRKKIK